LRLRGGFFTFEGHPDALLAGLGFHRAGFQHHLIETVAVVLLPNFDQVAIRPLHQAVQHLDHIDARAKG
jgi:hypothetical protein